MDNHVINRKNSVLKNMDKSFGELREQSSNFVDELVSLTENNPQTIINVTRNFLNKRENLSKLFEVSYSEKNSAEKSERRLPEKMKSITNTFELSGLFTLSAILLSEGKLNLSNLKNSQSVLFHLKSVGLNPKDTNNMRLIRNAASHKYTFEDEQIVCEKTRVSFKTIDELGPKLAQLMSWNLTLIFYSLFLVPKFGILAALSIYVHIKNNDGDWMQYMNGLRVFYCDLIKEAKIANEKAEQNNAETAGPEECIESSKIFIMQNLQTISERSNYHLNSIADTFSQLSDQIDSDEKETCQKIETWLRKGGNFMEVVSKECQEHPEKISAYFPIKIIKKPDMSQLANSKMQGKIDAYCKKIKKNPLNNISGNESELQYYDFHESF